MSTHELPALAANPARVEISPATGHTDAVSAVAFSPDGTLLASGSYDRTIKLWSGDGGRLLRTLEGHSGHIKALVFAPDGTRLFSASKDGSIGVWDTASGKRVAAIQAHSGGVFALIASRDGRRLYSGGQDKRIKIWDVASSRESASFGEFRGAGRTLALSPDQKSLLVGTYAWGDGVQLFDLESRRMLRRYADKDMSNDVAGVGFSPDGKRALVGYWAGSTFVYETSTGKVLSRTKTKALNNQPLLLGSGFVTKNGQQLELWDFSASAPRSVIKGHDHNILALDLSPDGRRLLSGSIDRSARLWDVASGRELAKLSGGVGFYYTVAYAPDGMSVARARGGYDEGSRTWQGTEVQILSLKTGAVVKTLGDGRTPAVTALGFSGDGKRLLAAHVSSGQLTYWDVASGGRLFESVPIGGHQIRALAVLDATQRGLLLPETAEPALIDLRSGRAVGKLNAGRVSNRALALSADGRVVATGHGATLVRFWDAASGRALGESITPPELIPPRPLPPDASALAFSADGRRLAVGESQNRTCHIRIVAVPGGELLQRFEAHTQGIDALAFTRDGRLLSGGRDAELCLWNAETGDKLECDRRYSGSVFQLWVAPDIALAASKDTSFHIWPLPR